MIPQRPAILARGVRIWIINRGDDVGLTTSLLMGAAAAESERNCHLREFMHVHLNALSRYRALWARRSCSLPVLKPSHCSMFPYHSARPAEDNVRSFAAI